MDHLQKWSRIFRSEETETDLSIWIPTEMSGIFGIMESTLCNKSSETSTNTWSTPASLSFKGQATKHTTVKWSIDDSNKQQYFSLKLVNYRAMRTLISLTLFFRTIMCTYFCNEKSKNMTTTYFSFFAFVKDIKLFRTFLKLDRICAKGVTSSSTRVLKIKT